MPLLSLVYFSTGCFFPALMAYFDSRSFLKLTKGKTKNDINYPDNFHPYEICNIFVLHGGLLKACLKVHVKQFISGWFSLVYIANTANSKIIKKNKKLFVQSLPSLYSSSQLHCYFELLEKKATVSN